MGIYRTYFDKNTTIIKDSKINTGRNQITQLKYGGGINRFLFYCDFNELRDKIEEKEIIIDSSVKHTLKLKNTSNFDLQSFLDVDNNLLFTDKNRASSFDLELKVVNEEWDQGLGYDFELSPFARTDDRSFIEEPTNWFDRNTIDDWSYPGAIFPNALTVAEQHFELGGEDVEMDVTDFVNDILLNEYTGTTNPTGTTGDYHGFCLKFTDEFEELVLSN
jgi:hypothetical protein